MLTLDDAPYSPGWPVIRGQLMKLAYKREDGCCFWCKRPVSRKRHNPATGPYPPDHATLDHIIPQSRGGKHEIENVVLACNACNNERGAIDAAAFAEMKLKR